MLLDLWLLSSCHRSTASLLLVGTVLMISLGKPRHACVNLLRQDTANATYGSIQAGQGRGSVVDKNGVSVRVPTSTPLPVRQLFVVFVMRLAEPIAYSQIFPYVNKMMEVIGAINDPREAGYYSGLMESTFAFAELLTIMRWGSLSDRIGRKPILLLGFFGAVLSTLLFGLSKSFIWALTARCLAGGLSGNVAVLLSAVGDMTDETNQAQAYAIFGIANNLAQMAGPAIGGTFAEPALNFPDSLGAIRLFQEFPFLLPCLLSALITFFSTVCCAMFFDETYHRDAARIQSESSGQMRLDQQSISIWNIATAPLMLSVLSPFFLLSMLNIAFLVVFSLFAYTSLAFGGLSRDPEEIGVAIASAGLIGAIIQVFILPKLQLRFGTVPLYRLLMSMWPLIYLMFPLLNGMARVLTEDIVYSVHPERIALWTGIATLLSLNRLASMAFSLNLILTKSAAPSAAVLGKVFALSHFVGCVARACAPSIVSSLFAFSKEKDILSGDFVWVVMCGISILGVWITFRARDGSVERHA